MALKSIKCTDFRCLRAAELEFSSGYNLIYGENASGKTSLLEAIGYLGRGRSFRGATTRELIRHGEDAFVLFGRVAAEGRTISLGVRNGKNGLEVHKDGEKRGSAAVLADSLPLQVVDPEVHELVAGGPEGRRKFADWIAFHVEQGYLGRWRMFRRALKQRNAALRAGTDGGGLTGWDQELAELGEGIDETRQTVLSLLREPLEKWGEVLLGSPIVFEYYRGWSADMSLAEAVVASRERDQKVGTSHVGPQRGDIRLKYDDRQARKLVSRGQQKLLACALVLGATELVQNSMQRSVLLLLDDPAAELDRGSLVRLMAAVESLECQVIATTLESDRALFSSAPRMFHVEQGAIAPA